MDVVGILQAAVWARRGAGDDSRLRDGYQKRNPLFLAVLINE